MAVLTTVAVVTAVGIVVGMILLLLASILTAGLSVLYNLAEYCESF